MDIAIIGYGRMGKEIERIASERGHTIKAIIDPNGNGTAKEISAGSLQDVDACIDFTVAGTALENIEKVSSLGKNMVIGTTGWFDQTDEAKKIVEDNNTGLIWSGNFSVGVNMFFRIIRNAARIINKVDDYDCFAYEMHHKNKADSPSGTAVMMGRILLEELSSKEKLVTGKLDRNIGKDELHFASVRGGSVPGTHSVGFDSQADTIELKHTARNRGGFALGAVMAAEWIKEKKGFYDINSFMDELLEGKK